MVLQVEFYWLCHAIISELGAPPNDLSRLRALSERQLENVQRLKRISHDMFNIGQSLLASDDVSVYRSATELCNYAAILLRISQSTEPIMDRIQLMSYSTFDSRISDKCKELIPAVKEVIEAIEWFRWDNPLNCTLFQDTEGRYPNDVLNKNWVLYPERAWGCFNASDEKWLLQKTVDSKFAARFKIVSPISAMPQDTVPSYLWWSCVQAYTFDAQEHRSLCERIITYNKEHIIASAGGHEFQGESPTVEQWSVVIPHIPQGISGPKFV